MKVGAMKVILTMDTSLAGSASAPTVDADR
jgi:hypothetical protein